jgi:hypothetical protein
VAWCLKDQRDKKKCRVGIHVVRLECSNLLTRPSYMLREDVRPTDLDSSFSIGWDMARNWP